MSIQAVNPSTNATIFASAGTGKTWLLVSRLLRLLLQGVRPDSILAITFTKKAAAEMYLRLLQRLEEWACCEESKLIEHLNMIDCPADTKHLELARQLYEQLLMSPYPLRISTFHAFCNDLLMQFPIEADLPPGFEIIDEAREQELHELAWSQLMSEASSDPQAELAQSLTTLFMHCGSTSAQTALNAFVQHRSDWWSWTENTDEPLQWAKRQLAEVFSQDEKNTLTGVFFSVDQTTALQRIAEALNHPQQPPTKKHIAEQLFNLLKTDASNEAKFDQLIESVLTKSGTIRKLGKPAKKIIETMGEAAITRLDEDWQQLGERCLALLDKLKQRENYNLNLAWYQAGSRYLELYQDYKLQNRQLDFADQEWRAYQLLNSRDDMLWVQYKLDQRIEHLLVDEFQDTNPTQWRLLLPLLEEFAASAEHQRSVFLVGDEKQSIYAFRRANPELQNVAAEWLEKNLNSKRFSMTVSYRSAPAIMDVVNRVFSDDAFNHLLPEFTAHSTHKETYWGRIEILPAFKIETETDPTETAFRNPLERPRPEAEKAQQAEAEAIAARIRRLVDEGALIEDEKTVRPVRYGDIKILLRKRTHSNFIEQALRAQKIPYQGTSRGGLLTSQEVADMQSLLTVLHTPQDNLALARVLVSPLFSASQEDLIRIASQPKGSWFERILHMAESCDAGQPISTAAEKLQCWQADSRILPLHDLLSKVYFEANVLARYRAAAEPWRQPQIETNLKRLLSLALEIDSGRYPSMNHFLMQLEQLQQAGDNAPSEPTPEHEEQPVEILTVHAAKGLEAPVIFLANMGSDRDNSKAWNALVNWPAHQKQPIHFLLQPTAAQMDTKTVQVLNTWREKLAREKANLLYVALTRARQMMVITASETAGKTGSSSLHAQLLQILEPMGDYDSDGRWFYETGNKPDVLQPTADKTSQQSLGKQILGLNQPIKIRPHTSFEIAPSHVADEAESAGEQNGRQRGVGIHYMLDKLVTTDWNQTAICHQAAASMNVSVDDPVLEAWYTEASHVIRSNPQLFLPPYYLQAWSELPVLYRIQQQQVYGIIDRMVEYDDHVLIVDYKTHRIHAPEDSQAIAGQYRQQLAYYQRGIQQLWQDKPVKTALLWTAINHLQIIEIEK